MDAIDDHFQTGALVDSIRSRKRSHETMLEEIERPATALLSQIDAKRAKIDNKRMEIANMHLEIERVEREVADLEVKRKAMLDEVAPERDAGKRVIDLHEQLESLLEECVDDDGSCLCVPIDCGYAIEPWLATMAGESGGTRAVHDENDALASSALGTLAQMRCRVIKAAIVVALETSAVDMTDHHDDPDFGFDDIEDEDLPPFEVQRWEVRDVDGTVLPLARMIQDDDYTMEKRAIQMAYHSQSTMEGDRRGPYFRDNVEIEAWAVCMPCAQREEEEDEEQ